MTKIIFNRLAWLVLLAVLAVTQVADAQYFTDNEFSGADVVAGFRKTGAYQENNQMVVYLGDVTNFLKLAAGTQITLTNYTTAQLTTLCPDNLGNLQWSVFASSEAATTPGTYVNTSGVWPAATCWYTVPRSNPSTQTAVPARLSKSKSANLEVSISPVSDGANYISGTLPGGLSNSTNSPYVLLEPISDDNSAYGYDGVTLDDYIQDPNSGSGDFGGGAFTTTVENITPSSFTTATVSDFYQSVPNSTKTDGLFVDPITGLTNGADYYVGYFTLNPGGAMTFTRASAAPVASFSGTPTIGFAPLTVIFTDSSTGSITSRVWTFGDGHSVTNNSTLTATNTYISGGSYAVTDTATGAGGSNTSTKSSYIVVSSTPKLGSISSSSTGTQLVFGGTGGPVGSQYRIFMTTNLTLPFASWTPVLTNTIPSSGNYYFTNSTTKAAAFFRLVSP